MDTISIRNAIKSNALIKAMSFNEFLSNSNQLLNRLHKQRMDSKYCDVKLIAENSSAYVHKCVLAAHSAYFDSLFKNLNRCVNEVNKEDNSLIDVLNVNAKHPELLMIVIDYVYTGTITLTSDNIAEVTGLASQFHLLKLEEHCSQYLNENVSEETCFYVLALAQQHNLSKLRNSVLGFIYSRIQTLLSSTSLLDLSVNILESFLGRSLPLTETQRLSTIVSWVLHRLPTRKALLPILLKFISWSQMTQGKYFILT